MPEVSYLGFDKYCDIYRLTVLRSARYILFSFQKEGIYTISRIINKS